jgi:hypothetical protein
MPRWGPLFFETWQPLVVDGAHEFTYPFSSNVVDALAALDRGDVVAYYATPAQSTNVLLAHSATVVAGQLNTTS